MDYQTLLQLRETCAGGNNTAKKWANSALKSLRFMETAGIEEDYNIVVDLTNTYDLPIMPWQYATEKGPNGQWAGEYVQWDWRRYIAGLSADQYSELFGEQGIQKFVFRALPFASPYPGLEGYPHCEFTAVRDDGIYVGLHPPGKKGQLNWTLLTDAERTAAMRAVKKKGLAKKSGHAMATNHPRTLNLPRTQCSNHRRS